MRIDHVIIGARDIGQLRALLWDGYGFGVVPGSAHPDGTQGWLVPFDTPAVQYLELITPGEPGVLAASDFGREFLDRTAAGPVFLNWAVLSLDIARDAARISELTGADPGLVRGESVRPDGRRYPWAEAAFEASWRCPARPFFLEYGDWPARVKRVPGDLRRAAHRRAPVEFTGIALRSTEEDLTAWWAGTPLPASIEKGTPDGVVAVRIDTADGEVEVRLP